LLGFLTNPFGFHPRSIEFHNNELQVAGRRVRGFPIASLVASPSVTKNYFGSSLRLSFDDGTTATLRGVRHREAISFGDFVQAEWTVYNNGRFEAELFTIDAVLGCLAELAEPSRYPSACRLLPFLEKARALDDRLLSKLPKDAVGKDTFNQIKTIQGFVKNAAAMRDRAINMFEAQQLPKWVTFFDTFENNPLTAEQRTSILADEDATLVLAGAGSGKTSIITAKAGYLIKSGIRLPKDCLLYTSPSPRDRTRSRMPSSA